MAVGEVYQVVAETCASGRDTGKGTAQENWKGKEANTKKSYPTFWDI